MLTFVKKGFKPGNLRITFDTGTTDMHVEKQNKKNTSVFDQNLLLKLNPEDTIVYEIKDSKYIYTKHKM